MAHWGAFAPKKMIHRIAFVMCFVFYSQMFSGGCMVIVRSVLEVSAWLWGTLEKLPEYPKTTPRYPVLVFDGFVTNFFEGFTDTAGCPI